MNANFDELAARRTIVANEVLSHTATRDLAERHLKPLGISSLLDAPVWECGEGAGVLRHEHVGPPRDWSPEEIDFVSALASIVSLALEESNRVRAAEILKDYLEQLEPAERKDHLQSLRQNTCRMARLMEEALLIGSLDAGKNEYQRGESNRQRHGADCEAASVQPRAPVAN